MRFEDILPTLENIFKKYEKTLPLKKNLNNFFVNRDLYGRITLVWDAEILQDIYSSSSEQLSALCEDISKNLDPYSRPSDQLIIAGNFPFTSEKAGAVEFSFGKEFPFNVVDRMLTESNWSSWSDSDELSAKMAVFYSIKGGVGRSTAVAAAAWFLARRGKKVMVVDMDLESPGISTSLLPADRRTEYGLLDWLVEDAVGNGGEVIESLSAFSPLAAECAGEIVVIPAHGGQDKDYIAKLGRAWLPRIADGSRIPWPVRIRNLLKELASRHQPDCILIDARAGLDEIASACVLDFAPKLVLLFALDGIQTWTGYSMLFHHWNKIGHVKDIRTSLQMIAAMIPNYPDTRPYVHKLRENAWDCFTQNLYDDQPSTGADAFSFDIADEEAPHSPWLINWNQGLSSMQQLYTLHLALDETQIEANFPFIKNFYNYFWEK